MHRRLKSKDCSTFSQVFDGVVVEFITLYGLQPVSILHGLSKRHVQVITMDHASHISVGQYTLPRLSRETSWIRLQN